MHRYITPQVERLEQRRDVSNAQHHLGLYGLARRDYDPPISPKTRRYAMLEWLRSVRGRAWYSFNRRRGPLGRMGGWVSRASSQNGDTDVRYYDDNSKYIKRHHCLAHLFFHISRPSSHNIPTLYLSAFIKNLPNSTGQNNESQSYQTRLVIFQFWK